MIQTISTSKIPISQSPEAETRGQNIKPISSNKLKDPIQLYPNPASNYVEISYTNKIDGEFILFNNIGDVILKASLPKEYLKRKIQLSDIAIGLYHYEIHFADGEKQFGKLSILK